MKALGKAGMLGNVLNHIDGGVEILDDLNDHWTAKNHKHERSIIMEDLQDLAMDKSVRITLLRYVEIILYNVFARKLANCGIVVMCIWLLLDNSTRTLNLDWSSIKIRDICQTLYRRPLSTPHHRT